jgi:hypothetical protein
MPVVYTPPYTPNSQYRPNLFVTYQTAPNPLVLAVAQIYVDGITLTTTIKKSPAYISGTDYYFEFDVSKILQSVSAPNPKTLTTVFPNTLNTSYDVLNSDCHTNVFILVEYFYNDPTTNVLTQLESGGSPVIDITLSGNYATIGTRQTGEYMGLDNYVIDYPTLPNVYDRYWLTNLPYVAPQAVTTTNNPIPICKFDNLNMSYIPTAGTNALRVIIYDASQTIVDSGFVTMTPNSTLTPRTIGVGIPQISQFTFSNALMPLLLASLPVGYYYSVQVGNLVGPSTFTLQGVKYMLKMVDCCANKVRLHWLNRLGGSDAYTFTNKKIVSESNSSSLAQKAQTWITTAPSSYTFDKGRFKIQQNATKEYEVESTFYDVSWGEWLAELLSSPEVYMETSVGLISVVITDSSIKIEETNELVNVTVKFIESNNISVQQN